MDLFEHLQLWVDNNAADLLARGVHVSLTHGPVGRDKRSAWVDLDSPARLVRLTVWESGEANLSVGDLATGAVISDEHLEVTSRFGLEQALGSAVALAETDPGGP